MSFKVAIIGRPNVGKSTLFNRLVGKRIALVDDQPGVTRDRREGDGRLGDLKFIVIDTAGLEEAAPDALETRMKAQTDRAIEEAHVCLFMIDGRVGVMPEDEKFGAALRASGKPVVLLVNKTEGKGLEGVYESYGLGLGEPIAVSAEHGEGMAEIYTALQPIHDSLNLKEVENERLDWDDPLKPLRVAIVGRPNAGKSTLVNQMIGDERMLTGPEAGITRDSIAIDWTWSGPDRDWPVKLHDTAGLRRKARVQEKLEKLSVADTLRAIRFAEVVILMLDADMALEKQDLQIADLALQEGRALVLVANKWDKVDDRQQALNDLRERVDRLLPQAPGLPIVTLSALTGRNVDRLMPVVTKVYVDWNAKVKTSDLNVWLEDATSRHPPPAVKGRRIKIRYIAQTKTRPPTFVAHSQRAEELPESYRRYLMNGIREAFDLPAVPIRLLFRSQKNPFESKKKRR
ncbi:ribosome biogenesis GTPase Der [Aquisalinus flavus]|uniref:GTPase Der n=1 Tax=Aquisalinus flavus TaxID=1526572 RepID=A0A8J2V2N3_9PROT|nr:ribosome biogenesis GTPase Der [Aquisalinus flavus]MBD0427640.1 ribosome biogenesis GTPase Der [Aquisalinus flavus]UNE47427.1 ribosome biogenesis GTPase Der [Aquisalinus flavus]GGD02610.1 GTPase Der [Aquisalinus flavus]